MPLLHGCVVGFDLGKKRGCNDAPTNDLNPVTRCFVHERLVSGHRLSEVLGAMLDAIRARGLKARVVRFRHTADTSFLGLSAARLAGSGIGIGIQAKGTAVIHQRGRQPHNNLELFSNAPITRLEHYRALGANAAAYALGEMPEPIVVPQRGEAMGSRYHARVALIYAIETGLTEAGAAPEEVDVTLTGVKS